MESRTVHLYLPDGMADWEAGYAVAGINQPAFQLNPGRYHVLTVGADRQLIRTMGGMGILPDLALAELSPADSAMLILPGAASWDEGRHGAAAEKAAAFLEAGVPVAAICGATAGLAQQQLLNERPHTSNAPEYLAALAGYSGQSFYAGDAAVSDGDLITASGTAPLEFARAIFERLELYAPPVLDAWYALYARGDASGFEALQAGGEGA